jgi:hypothetical protein
MPTTKSRYWVSSRRIIHDAKRKSEQCGAEYVRSVQRFAELQSAINYVNAPFRRGKAGRLCKRCFPNK